MSAEKLGFASVIIKPVEIDLCDWCAHEEKEIPATHEIEIAHWFKWLGAIGKHRACQRHADEIAAEMRRQIGELPIPMLLFCPACKVQHVDAPQPDKGWYNPPHRSHECQRCGHIWRPCDVATDGVASIVTKGKRDGSPVPA